MTRSKQPDLVLYILYLSLFVSMIGCFRAVSSICTGLLLLAGLFKNKLDTGSWLSARLYNPFLLACGFFYLLQVLSLLYTPDFNEALKNAQIKSGLVFIPLALCCSYFTTIQVWERLMKYYVWVMAAGLLYCLVLAIIKYTAGNAAPGIFFYHQLVSPFRQHAVQVAIYIFIALVYLLEKAASGYRFYSKTIHALLIAFFIGCILLLSSKLVISFSVCCLVYYGIRTIKARIRYRFIFVFSLTAALFMMAMVLLTRNQVSRRFTEIFSGNLKLVEQPHFNTGIYFNGLQFRLLQWRFVKEILSEQHAWLSGVGDNAQPLLNQKYTNTGMYTGDARRGDQGYLSYNTHNQFLQSLLQFGIIGLLAFIVICVTMVQMAMKNHNRQLSVIAILLLAYCFNEAVFETQYGLTLFTFFPLFFYYGTATKEAPAKAMVRPVAI